MAKAIRMVIRKVNLIAVRLIEKVTGGQDRLNSSPLSSRFFYFIGYGEYKRSIDFGIAEIERFEESGGACQNKKLSNLCVWDILR